jgi:N-acetylmuramoyl-L-alanine amidase
MNIRDHRLCEDDGTPVPFVASPNHGEGLEPIYLVVHYTATTTLDAVVDWFRSPSANASAHVIVDRDGRAVQMVSLDRRAWHAGTSRWEERENLNAYSVGIDLVNAGSLERGRFWGWVDWSGRRVRRRETLTARHKHQSVNRRWHRFTPPQIERALAIARTLHRHFRFKAGLGHDDIAPDRKIDPGPAFPMAWFASEVLADHSGANGSARAETS